MNQFCRRLALLPICATLAMGSIAGGAAIENAPTIQDVNNAMQAEDYERVEGMCREIVAEDPTHAQAWFLLGYALHAQGEIDRAIFAHLTATSFPSTAPLAFYNLGCAHALKGNTDQAFKALDKAVGLGITNPEQYKGDSDLKSLQSDARWGKLIKSMQPQLVAKSAPKKAPKSAVDSASAALHFWVGAWDCYSAKDGKLVGRNTLKFRVGKRAIHESWVSEGDSYAGESWTHFDPRSGTWKQIWTGANGDLAEFESDPSSDVEHGLSFVGSAFAAAQSRTEMRRMHVRPIGDGRLRHTGTASSDDGDTWIVKYDLIYVPKGEQFELEELSI